MVDNGYFSADIEIAAAFDIDDFDDGEGSGRSGAIPLFLAVGASEKEFDESFLGGEDSEDAIIIAKGDGIDDNAFCGEFFHGTNILGKKYNNKISGVRVTCVLSSLNSDPAKAAPSVYIIPRARARACARIFFLLYLHSIPILLK